VVTLQEMDAPGVERLARALGYDYVYYPAAVHPTAGKDFGNAILVRGRILADHKVLLPYPSRSRGLQRIAVAAEQMKDGKWSAVPNTQLSTPTGERNIDLPIADARFATEEEAENFEVNRAREWIEKNAPRLVALLVFLTSVTR